MTLVTHRFTCRNGHKFEAAATSGGYGEFLVRGGLEPTPGLLLAYDDAVFSEIDRILDTVGAYAGKSDQERSELLWRVFGVGCDPAPDGTELEINRLAPCPVCGTRVMESWAPVAAYSGPSFTITHNAWSRLSDRQKQAMVASALEPRDGCGGLLAPNS